MPYYKRRRHYAPRRFRRTRRRYPVRRRTFRRRYGRKRRYRGASARLGKSKTRTLRQRVRLLEAPCKKHFDTTEIVASGASDSFAVAWNGMVDINTPAPTSGIQLDFWMNVPGKTSVGVGPATSGNFLASPTNVRTSDRIFAKKVVVCGTLVAPFARSQFQEPQPPNPEDTIIATANTQAMATCTFWVVVLRDTVPALMDENGEMEPNSDPTNDNVAPDPLFAGPMEQQFQIVNEGQPTATSTLESLGLHAAFKSYDKTRFKIAYKKKYVLSQNKPMLDFKIDVKLNKYLKYKPARPGAAVNLPAEPISNRYCFTIVSNWTETMGIFENPEDTNIPPQVTNLRSRLYFRDA